MLSWNLVLGPEKKLECSVLIMNIGFIITFFILTLYNPYIFRIFGSQKQSMKSYHSGAFPPFFLLSYWLKGFLFFSKMETENWEWEWEEAQTEFGGMKKRGVRAGVREHCLTRANKYEKPFNGLRTGPNTFLPPHTIVLYSIEYKPHPVHALCAEIHSVWAHVTSLKLITSTLFDKLLH